MKNIIKYRALVSSLLLFSFIMVFLSGFSLLLTDVFSSQNTFFSFLLMYKSQLKRTHIISAILMSFFVFIHFFFNYKMFFNELKILFKKR